MYSRDRPQSFYTLCYLIVSTPSENGTDIPQMSRRWVIFKKCSDLIIYGGIAVQGYFARVISGGFIHWVQIDLGMGIYDAVALFKVFNWTDFGEGSI